MSALAGRWNWDGRPDADAACERMLAAQKIYGPHDMARWDDGAVSIGRCLFRTLPEDIHDRQPLAGGGGRWHMVADVRLDNREELAADLAIDPADAARMADAALLLAAWERWEEAVFDRLLGDYAFAVWDGVGRRLILARDPFGARPLHYHRGRDFIAFATMPKGLHALPEIPYGPDEVRVAELLALLPEYGDRSFFQDVSRVESGHVVILTAEGVTARRHWAPQRQTIRLASPAAYAEALRGHLDRAVTARLRGADGRVAAHLSAGWDSSAVAATAARLLAPGGGTVTAFTSVPREGYDGPDPERRFGDEGPLAAATAALYPNMDHVLVRSDASGAMDDFDRNFFLFERPILNACNQRWINAINGQARTRGLKVLLTGQMGNMTISYAGIEYLPELIARGRWLRWLREGLALTRAKRIRWRGFLLGSLGPWMPGALWRRIHRIAGKLPLELDQYSAIHAERYAALGMADRARDQALDPSYRPRKEAFETRLWVMRRVDQGNYNKGVLAGWGVDQRDPTADRRLAEFCLSLPMEAYLADGKPRVLGRAALADRLPQSVLAAAGTGIQAVDWHEGLTAARDEIREEIARLENVPSAATALDLAQLREMVEDWPTEGWHRPEVMRPYRLKLLRGLVSGHFLRKASRSNA